MGIGVIKELIEKDVIFSKKRERFELMMFTLILPIFRKLEDAEEEAVRYKRVFRQKSTNFVLYNPN